MTVKQIAEVVAHLQLVARHMRQDAKKFQLSTVSSTINELAAALESVALLGDELSRQRLELKQLTLEALEKRSTMDESVRLHAAEIQEAILACPRCVGATPRRLRMPGRALCKECADELSVPPGGAA